jgi:hypothetical protein
MGRGSTVMERRIRFGAAVIAAATTWGVLAVVALTLGVANWIGDRVLVGGLAVLAGMLLAVLSYRCTMLGAYIGEEQLMVRNTFGTYRVSWDAIEDFRLLSTSTVWVFMKGGKRRPIWGLSAPMIGRDFLRLAPMIDDLRAITAERRDTQGHRSVGRGAPGQDSA